MRERTNREKALSAIRRESGDYVPFEFGLCPSLYRIFCEKTGAKNPGEFYRMAYGYVYCAPKDRGIDFSRYFNGLKKNAYFNEFGVAYEPSGAEHFTHMVAPMKNFSSLKEFKAYPYPDAEKDYDWEIVKKDVRKTKASDRLAVAGMAMTIFEIGWYMRGMEEFLTDMLDESGFLEYHLERICRIRCRQAELYALAGVDILHIGDDIANQLNMMFSLEQYRKWIKPYHQRVICAAKKINPDIIIDYHSDGNCTAAIDDLIEIGIDILNPVQPECMDIKTIKEKYGDRLSFRGAIGTQTTMPFGTAAEVAKEAERTIGIMGSGGGLILAPSHVLEPEVPWENVEAFINAVKAYNNGS